MNSIGQDLPCVDIIYVLKYRPYVSSFDANLGLSSFAIDLKEIARDLTETSPQRIMHLQYIIIHIHIKMSPKLFCLRL